MLHLRGFYNIFLRKSPKQPEQVSSLETEKAKLPSNLQVLTHERKQGYSLEYTYSNSPYTNVSVLRSVEHRGEFLVAGVYQWPFRVNGQVVGQVYRKITSQNEMETIINGIKSSYFGKKPESMKEQEFQEHIAKLERELAIKFTTD